MKVVRVDENGRVIRTAASFDWLFRPTLADEYELALQIGDKRFGSECRHEKVKNGHCENCLRRVIT
ncbi:hypothetical protein ACFLXE_00050 [Chloroflexota bacterium]